MQCTKCTGTYQFRWRLPNALQLSQQPWSRAYLSLQHRSLEHPTMGRQDWVSRRTYQYHSRKPSIRGAKTSHRPVTPKSTSPRSQSTIQLLISSSCNESPNTQDCSAWILAPRQRALTKSNATPQSHGPFPPP